MRYQWAVVLLWFGMVLSYAAWKGNALAAIETKYFNANGQQVFPVIAKSLEQVAAMNGITYYTGPDGQQYTDVYTQQLSYFNWDTFFQVTTFGFGLALLVLIVVRLSARFSKESIAKP